MLFSLCSSSWAWYMLPITNKPFLYLPCLFFLLFSSWLDLNSASWISSLQPPTCHLLSFKMWDYSWEGGGLQAGWLLFVHLVIRCLLTVSVSAPSDRKLAKKRKDAIGTTRQEMTHMVNAMDRSYADQSTLHGEDPMAVTFMDSHNYNNRCRFINKTIITNIVIIMGYLLL